MPHVESDLINARSTAEMMGIGKGDTHEFVNCNKSELEKFKNAFEKMITAET